MNGESRTIRRIALGMTGIVALLAALALLPASASAAGKRTIWLCKPGLADNPCKPDLSTTQISPTGEVLGTTDPRRKRHPRFDCFYVYPTVSDDEGANSDRSRDPEERSIAVYQAARYSQRCRVFAPMYRQITLSALFSGEPVTEEQQRLAYEDVRRAWKKYLRKHNHGRGVVLIGHSQGTRVLHDLIAEEIDTKRRVRRRIVSALLLGGNILTDEGRRWGGELESFKGCKRPKQFRCVVAFSTFDEPVPDGALFGRPGPFLGGDPAADDVLCTNPAALGGRKAPLDAVMPSEPFAPGTTIGAATTALGFPTAEVETAFIEAEGAYRGRCSSARDANVLRIEPVGGAPDLKAIPSAAWGLHLIDANIVLGDLVRLVKRQAAAWAKRR